jgi:hypothetical protein
MGEADLPETISYFDYLDLTRRLGVRSTNGGSLVRGQDHLQMVEDGDHIEPARDPGEDEIARLAAVVDLYGPVEGDVGPVMRAAAMLIVTSKRMVITGIGGESVHGPIAHGREVHTLFWPWDLVDVISMPAKARLADRIAGNRTIEIFSSVGPTIIRLVPSRVKQDGAEDKIEALQAFGLLTDAVAEHRLTVSSDEYHADLEAIIAGDVPVENGELTAQVTPDDAGQIPPHLTGRLLDGDGNLL